LSDYKDIKGGNENVSLSGPLRMRLHRAAQEDKERTKNKIIKDGIEREVARHERAMKKAGK